MDGIADAYDRWSEGYDSQDNSTRDLDGLVLCKVAPDLEGRTVLECGCGTGKNSLWLAPRCARLLGLDFSMGMLDIARRKVREPNVLFVRQDLRQPWPVAPEVADLVLFNLVLEHVEELGPLFAEAGGALKPGGSMILSEYHPSRVAEGKGPVAMDPAGAGPQRIDNYLHTMADYVASAEAAGLALMDQQEWTEASFSGVAGSEPGSVDTRPQLLSLVFRR